MDGKDKNNRFLIETRRIIVAVEKLPRLFRDEILGTILLVPGDRYADLIKRFPYDNIPAIAGKFGITRPAAGSYKRFGRLPITLETGLEDDDTQSASSGQGTFTVAEAVSVVWKCLVENAGSENSGDNEIASCGYIDIRQVWREALRLDIMASPQNKIFTGDAENKVRAAFSSLSRHSNDLTVRETRVELASILASSLINKRINDFREGTFVSDKRDYPTPLAITGPALL